MVSTEWFEFNATTDGYFQIRYEMACSAVVDDPAKVREGEIKVKERYCKTGGRCVEGWLI